MDRTRIRWSNVGRLAGGLGAGALLLAFVPGLLEPGEPAPLPADVGLDPAGADGYAYAPAGRRPREHRDRHPGRPPGQRRSGSPRPEAADRPRARARHHRVPSPADHPDARRPAESASEAAHAPAAPAPAPASAPLPPAPPPPPPAAAPSPPPTSPPAAPPEPAEHEPDPEPPAAPSGSPFGFER